MDGVGVADADAVVEGVRELDGVLDAVGELDGVGGAEGEGVADREVDGELEGVRVAEGVGVADALAVEVADCDGVGVLVTGCEHNSVPLSQSAPVNALQTMLGPSKRHMSVVQHCPPSHCSPTSTTPLPQVGLTQGLMSVARLGPGGNGNV